MFEHEKDLKRLPRTFVWFIIFISIFPAILNLIGIDFGNESVHFSTELSGSKISDQHFLMLGGAFTHTILEWSALMLALLACGLAFTNYIVQKDPVAPVLGVALLCAGLMDGFHTLAAARLIEAIAPNKDLIPFTWALCRLFNSLICLIGICVVLFGKKRSNKENFKLIIGVSFFFIVVAYLTVHFCALSEKLPQTQFPNSIITRPWDIYPFIIFLITSFAYYKYYKKKPSPFVHALLLSTIPDLVTQAHMALGSTSLFDNHFNIAHFLKIVSYGVPYLGLTWSYVTTNKEKDSLNEELSIARDSALQAEKAKSEFLANMSHEIRTPMNGVLGMVQLLNETNLSKEQKDLVETTRTCGDSLLSILNDVLDLSKIESGKLDLEIIDFDLSKCIEDAVYLSSYSASKKGINLEFLCDEKQPKWFMGDVTRIRQVIVNFISNAVKFTDKGSVIISTSLTNRTNEMCMLKITVKDTGLGIPKNAQGRLFKAFSQADTSTTRKYGGTGLGLSICNHLAQIMGGQVGFVSSDGVGSSFFITIPLKFGVEEVIEDNIGITSMKIKGDTLMSKYFPNKILVVEDNNINQKLAKMMLKKNGYDCDIAANGIEALEALEANSKIESDNLKPYSIIFMDMQMPEMDGLEATKRILEIYGNERPKIVAMTANAFKEDKAKCFDVGMDDFISKPVRMEDLRRVLGNYSSSNEKIKKPQC